MSSYKIAKPGETSEIGLLDKDRHFRRLLLVRDQHIAREVKSICRSRQLHGRHTGFPIPDVSTRSFLSSSTSSCTVSHSCSSSSSSRILTFKTISTMTLQCQQGAGQGPSEDGATARTSVSKPKHGEIRFVIMPSQRAHSQEGPPAVQRISRTQSCGHTQECGRTEMDRRHRHPTIAHSRTNTYARP